MLDELLGRAELKARIEDLEEERTHLERQLEAEAERRAEAVSERQAAEERVNRLEDRIADLEGQLDRRDPEAAERSFRRVETVRGDRLEEVLARLERVRTGPEGALTAMVADGHDLPEAVRDAFGDRSPLVARAAPCLAVTDDAGLVSACLSVPVAPEPFATWEDRFVLEADWFRPVGSYALALVRGDVFALGEYVDGERTAFEGFESEVGANHSKGGFSQGRFERRRDEQIADHLERCREALEERSADRLFVVGEGSLLPEFADVAEVTAAVDATGDPEAALGDAARAFWSVRLRAV